LKIYGHVRRDRNVISVGICIRDKRFVDEEEEVFSCV
jgi:hypothetical protein